MLVESLLLATLAFDSGVQSINAVGYVNVAIPSGLSLLSNPLINKNDSRILSLFGAVHTDGSKIHLLRENGFITVEYFADSNEWLPTEYAEIELYPGEGFFFENAGGPLAITFVGEVPEGSLTNHLPAGYSLRASMVPAEDTIERWNFPSEPGDQIFLFDSATKRYSLYYFDDFESRWIPSAPPVRPGSAFCVFKQKATDWVETFSIRGSQQD